MICLRKTLKKLTLGLKEMYVNDVSSEGMKFTHWMGQQESWCCYSRDVKCNDNNKAPI